MIKLIPLLLFALSLHAFAFDPTSDPDVLTYYTFDEIAQDSAFDHSINSYNAHLYNVSIKDGIRGKSIAFNNTDSHLNGGNTPDVQEYTIMAWIKPYAYGEATGKHAKLVFEKTYSYYMNILSENTGNRREGHMRVGGLFSNTDGSKQKWEFLDSPNQIPLNKWTLAACTFKEGKLKLYLDGALVSEKEIYPILKNYAYNTVWGALQKKETGLYHGSFYGEMDECILVKRALKAKEIKQWHNKFN